MQRLSFAQSPHIMEACIKQSCTSTKRLQASTYLGFTFQYSDLHTILSQNVTTFQPAQSCSYNDDTISFHDDWNCLAKKSNFMSQRNKAGCNV